MLGNTVDVAHETLNAGIDLHEFAPLPGLAPAARTLLEIWDGLPTVDVSYQRRFLHSAHHYLVDESCRLSPFN